MNAEWQEKPIGEVIKLEYGKPLEDGDRKPDGLYPVYGANGEKNRTDKFYYDKPSIIVGRKGSAGELNLTESKFWPLDVTYFVTFDEQKHNLRFLYYLLTTLDLPRLAKGVKPGINRNEVYSQTSKIPSLAEQQRIVAVLDEAFEGIAVAKAGAEKNLGNARTLFESYLQSVFTKRGEGWTERPLNAICDLQNGYAFKSGDYIGSSNTLNIRMSAIRPDGRFDPEHNQRFLPDSYAKEYASFLLKDGDLIIAMTDMAGDPKILGVPTLVSNQNGRTFLMNQRVGKLFKFSSDVRVGYLRYFLTAPSMKQFYKSKGAGGLQINISKGDILSAKIPLPRVTEQDRIVDQLDDLSEETKRLAAIYEGKLAALEALKKSLLHKAFTGNL